MLLFLLLLGLGNDMNSWAWMSVSQASLKNAVLLKLVTNLIQQSKLLVNQKLKTNKSQSCVSLGMHLRLKTNTIQATFVYANQGWI